VIQSVPTLAGPLLSKHQWVSIDATVRDEQFRFASTHFEAGRSVELVHIRDAQVKEILESLELQTTALPVILAGGFNFRIGVPEADGITSAVDSILEVGFTDAFQEAGSGDGLTYGHDIALADPTRLFTDTVDITTY
jgi:endonuclease/exonuclease/phosphatase family metal-dependent hydrolase